MIDLDIEDVRLCEYEIEILREVAGEKPISPWGASVGSALEYLEGNDFIAGGKITAKGEEVLAKLKHQEFES